MRRPRAIIGRRRGVIGPREGVTRRPLGVIGRRREVIAGREGFTTGPEGFITAPEGFLAATIPTQIGTLWAPSGDGTTSPSPPRTSGARLGTACPAISTPPGRLVSQRRPLRTERRREVTPRGPLGSQIRRFEKSRVPRRVAKGAVMTSPCPLMNPSRPVRTQSDTRRAQIGSPSVRREPPCPKAWHGCPGASRTLGRSGTSLQEHGTPVVEHERRRSKYGTARERFASTSCRAGARTRSRRRARVVLVYPTRYPRAGGPLQRRRHPGVLRLAVRFDGDQ